MEHHQQAAPPPTAAVKRRSSLAHRLLRLYRVKTSSFVELAPNVFFPNARLLRQIHHHQRQASSSAKAVTDKLARSLGKISRLSHGLMQVVDCGTDLLLPSSASSNTHEVLQRFPVSGDAHGLPALEQLVSEAQLVRERSTASSSSTVVVVVVVNNTRHCAALAALVLCTCEEEKEGFERIWRAQLARFSSSTKQQQLSKSLSSKLDLARDLHMLQTVGVKMVLLLRPPPPHPQEEESLYLDSVELSPAWEYAAAASTSSSHPPGYLLILGRSSSNGGGGEVVVHAGNAAAVSPADTRIQFAVGRELGGGGGGRGGGLWITLRESFGRREVVRVFVHCALVEERTTTTLVFSRADCLVVEDDADDDNNGDNGGDDVEHKLLLARHRVVLPPDFTLTVRFTPPPPLTDDDDGVEEEEDPEALRRAEESLLLSTDEQYARSLQLEGDHVHEDEMLAWSLHMEEEMHRTLSTAYNNGGGRRAQELSLAQLPLSIYSCAATGSASATGPSASSSSAPTCLVCQHRFVAGDCVRTLPCFHGFHPQCCDPWFIVKPVCPLCQTPIHVPLQDDDADEDNDAGDRV